MKVVVTPVAVRLEETSDFKRFDVLVRTDEATAAARLTLARAGRITHDEHVAVSVPWVRFAAGQVSETPEWQEQFTALLGYAASKGWFTEAGEILGHIVWEPVERPAYRLAVVGLGAQGGGIVRSLATLGHDVVAGVDIGDRVGRPLSEVVAGYDGGGIVLATVEELIAAHPDLDLVALSAAVGLETTLAWAEQLLAAGINVVTLDAESFAYDRSWALALDATAKAGGASYLAVGVQDVAWVQLIATAGAAVTGVRKISLTNIVPMEVLSPGIVGHLGAGGTAEEFAAARETAPEGPSLVGAPLVEVARLLGAKAGPVTTSVEPFIGTSDYDYRAGGTTFPAGTVQGVRERAAFSTDLGIDFEGVIQVVPGGEEVSENVVEFVGEPDLRVTLGPITAGVTDTALVSRIPDVINAPAGVLFSADLPAAHTHLGAKK